MISSTWMALSHSEAQTEAIARSLAACLTPGMAILLSGDLGSGKSLFARGLIWGLGVQETYLTSPTFTLVNVYSEGRMPIAHFDLYRLSSLEEVDGLGLEEYVDGRGVTIVEWPEQGEGAFFGDPLEVRLSYDANDPQTRLIAMAALGSLSHECLQAFTFKDLRGR